MSIEKNIKTGKDFFAAIGHLDRSSNKLNPIPRRQPEKGQFQQKL
ncbi:hypothetical protein OEG84_08375 [Hoeflea sp. G2-23]|uniref:Transposase n=1 Tax=Hoeflea algicola TaxID=2983763 RepID=A0ABT3Z7I0_9HYPH|nr:hypothetical protein [Hoeflea algicola]MCY0147731.1 hypothetical protein [Hoeflea algicola]